MSVLWKITLRTEQEGVRHMEVNIDERICDITPMSKGLCGFPLYSWVQAKLTPRTCERAPRRALPTPSRGSRWCTVQARISGRQPVKLTVPIESTVDELNWLAREALRLTGAMSWADQLVGASVVWETPWFE